MTGILLAIARIAGETAPLLFTALSNQFWSTDMMQPIANLPVTIFKFAMSPFAEWQQLAWAGVLIITLCVLLLNILARVVLRRINTVDIADTVFPHPNPLPRGRGTDRAPFDSVHG